MPKNIVICCDGTGNEFCAEQDSNVVKLYSALIIQSDTQVAYYHPGVGTMGSPNARGPLERWWTRTLGLGFGRGLFANVSDAYRYLMERYEPGDRIFLFGFSRGAYTARVLASVLHLFGLLHRGNEGQIPYMLRMLSSQSKQLKNESANSAKILDIDFQFKDTFSRTVALHFLGVWDTVSSVGWVWDPLKLPFSARNPIMATGRQAISIDERRCFFRQNLWGKPFRVGDPGYLLGRDQDIKQVWFAGVHSDVGGSYDEPVSGLSKLTLEWMMREAELAGLVLDHNRCNQVLGRVPYAHPRPFAIAQPDANAPQHESLRGAWWILECLPHRYYNWQDKCFYWTIPLGKRRFVAPDAVVHDSVLQRINYNPANLPDKASHPHEPWTHFPAASAQSVP